MSEKATPRRRYDVTRAGFYAWRRRDVSARALQDRRLTAAIARLFMQHQQRYGSPRIYRELTHRGWTVSRRCVARLMRAAGLRAKAVRGYRAKSGIRARFAQHPNRVWEAHVTRSNHVWVSDITYLPSPTAGAISPSCWITTHAACSPGRSVVVARRGKPAGASRRRSRVADRRAG